LYYFVVNQHSNFIGIYSQGLPHNAIGEVDLPAYQALLTAVKSGDPDDFAKIPLGGNTKLQDPQGGLALNSAAIGEISKKYPGSYLWPAAFPGGNPQHPSYAEGHGAIAGACVTALKASYNESFVITDPMIPSDDGQSLSPYKGTDAGQITVGGELNKLAINVALGRDIAGVHWRSDALQALLLGEAITISIL
jgi:hypothetical protein